MTGNIKSASRVVIKVGSALLVDPGSGVRQRWLDSLCADIAALHEEGKEVLIVSSGAIAFGRNKLNLPKRALRLDENQAAAAVGQIALGRAWSEGLGTHDLVAGQLLLTSSDTEGGASRRNYLNARDTIQRLLKLRAVPVINENDTVATSEIRYGDNDRLAARVATMVSADLLILLSDVDGLYTKPPAENADADFIEHVPEISPDIMAMAGSAGSELSRGGMVTKIEAGKIATNAGTAMIITSGKKDHPISAILAGDRHTWFAPVKTQERARKTWIAGQLETAGSIVIDDGATQALFAGKSLLPAGVRSVNGVFNRGDAIAILGPDDEHIGQGLAGYDSADAQLIAGCRSDELADVLGYEGRPNMIHRDDLVLQADTKTKEPKEA